MTRQLPMRYKQESNTPKKALNCMVEIEVYQYLMRIADGRGISLAKALKQILTEHAIHYKMLQ